MDAEFVNPFIEATLHILETTAKMQAKAKRPYLKKDEVAKGTISCMLELSGDFKGTISVSFMEDCILNIVSKMFMEEMTEVNDDIKDAVGEIGNMICGQVTTKLTELGKTLKAQMKIVSMGQDHTITHLSDRPVIAMPYDTENGEFTIEVCFEE